MSDAWQSIKIRQFEHVSSGADTSLLRISGKSPWRRATSTRPTLRVDRHGDAHRFAALPAPDDPRGSMAAAYSIPSALIAADSKFWLEHADGALTELPPPVPGDLPATERRSDLLAQLAEQSRELARAEREAVENEQARRIAETELARARAAREPTMSRAREGREETATTQIEPSALERELAALRSSRASLEQELDQSRDQLRIMTFERDELSRQAAAFDGVAVKARERASKAEAENEQLRDTIRELEVWRGELERRLAAISSELGVAKAAREADERELKRLREALAEADARGDRDGQTGDASQTLAAQAAEIELLVAELASLRDAQSRPEPAGADRISEQASARIARLEAERAELARRAEQLEAALKDALGPAQALLELARAGLVQRPATAEGATAEAEAELIGRSAQPTAREQDEREFGKATPEYSRGGSAG